MTSDVRLPLEPILAQFDSEDEARRYLRLGGGTFTRYKDQGIRERTADTLAARIGCHPAELWPDWYSIEGHEHPDERVVVTAELPSHWTVAWTCPHCARNVRPVNVGVPTDGGKRITGLAVCEARAPHHIQFTVLLEAV